MRENLTVWTNKTDIKTGITFQEAINKGVEGADNFVYLISPDSLESEYCQQELAHAFANNKRIIPLLIEETDLDSIPSQLRNLQFIDFTGYQEENSYQKSIDKLLGEIKKEPSYYEKHKILLVKALKWQRQNFNPSILFRGYNLQKFEAWLKVARLRDDYPPLPLQEDFITASFNQPEVTYAEVFISYSRTDSDLARKLNDRLQELGKTTWFDQESIATGTDFQQEIYRGIESSDNFLFIISPKSVNSPYCADEVEYAQKLGKRFITILHRKLSAEDKKNLPPALARIQYLDFNQHGGEFAANFNELVRTLDTDRDHVSNHRKWSQRALEWQEKGGEERLLRGSELAIAQNWLEEASKNNKQPPGTELQKEFIGASADLRDHQAELEQERKLKELEAEVALSTEKERNQILNQALTDAEVTIADAQKKRRKIIRQGLITLAGITVVTIAASIAAIFASQKLIKAQKGTQLEQASVNLLRQFPAGELTALISALENGQELQNLVKGNNKLQDYPTIQPLFVLQHILDNIHQSNEFESQQGEIQTVRFTPNGEKIVSGGTDRDGDKLIGTVKVWNFSGKELAKWTAHQEGINHLSLSPNGEQIATAGADGMIRLWNVSGQKLDEKKAYDVSGGVNQLNFSPNGKHIVAAGGDGKLQLWNVSGQKLVKQKEWKAVDQEFAGLRSVAISPNGQQIVSGGDDGMITLWNLSGEKLGQWNAHKNQSIASVTFSPDGQRIATIAKDNIAKVWDVSGTLLVELKGHQGGITSISFSPDGKHLVTSGKSDLTIRRWDLSGKEIAQLRGHSKVIWSANFSNDGQHLVSAGRSGKIFLWDISEKPMVSFQANDADINSLSFSPDGQQIVTVGDDGMIRLWKTSGENLNQWSASQLRRKIPIKRVSFSPDGKRLVVSYNNNRVRIWSISGEKMDLFDKHRGLVHNVNFSPNGQYIATAGSDGIAMVWDVSQNKFTELKGHQGSIWDVIFSPDGKLIGTAGNDGTIRVWDLSGQEQVKRQSHQGQVRTISFSPDGQEIVSAGDDGKVRVWSIKGQLKSQPFDTYQGIIYSLSFSPDGQKIATAGRDGTVRGWDKLGRQLFEFQGEGNIFWNLNFSPDGQFLAAAEYQGIVYILKVNDLEQLLKEGCDWLEDYLHEKSTPPGNIKTCQKR
ncbi:MAG: TIR domain-containing protein, partial [Microcystaceae cyanobacterium]